MKCSCPVWCDGEVRGQRVRQSLHTRDWARAGRKIAALESDLDSGRVRKSVPSAVSAFLEQCSVQKPSFKKYSRWLDALCTFVAENNIIHLNELNLECLDRYRASREVCALTWSKELQFLRTFFTFCGDRKWIDENPAKQMKMPPDAKPKERKPYTSEEITRILAACETFGRNAYERLRARAMILLMRFYGLRVSDVATLARENVQADEIFLHAVKNGSPLWVPLLPEVARALECVPLPQGAGQDCKYYFWTGLGSREGHIKTVDRTLQAVFRKSGVENAHAHRFRHTMTTDILVKGGTIEDAANILGDSPATIRKYYAKWSVAYRDRTVEIMRRVHGTSAAHTRNQFRNPLFSDDLLVLEEGVEPSCPVKGAGF